jgi:hypothetical protein
MKNQKKYICLEGSAVFVSIKERIKQGWEIYSQPVVKENKSFFCILSTESIRDELVKVACIDRTKGEAYDDAPSENFLIGKFLVTIGHWNYVRSFSIQEGYDIPFSRVSRPHEFSFDDPAIHFDPASRISFFDACKWCNAKSEMENLEPVYYIKENIFRTGEPDLDQLICDVKKTGYRLPTSKEFLWVAKGGIFQFSHVENIGDKTTHPLEIESIGDFWQWCDHNDKEAVVMCGTEESQFRSPKDRDSLRGFGMRIVRNLNNIDTKASNSSASHKENSTNPSLTGVGSISLVSTHWDKFSSIPHKAAGPIGVAPAKWAKTHGLLGVPSPNALPTHQLNRTDVRAICRDMSKDVLFGYVCAMAWGSQGRGRGGAANLKKAWSYLTTSQNQKNLDNLRNNQYSRTKAYSLLNGKIPGVGPAYFTKLLFFFSPQPNLYIMDQWTAKSINLLTGKKVVIIEQSGAVSGRNTAANYENYCSVVDEIAAQLKLSGEDVEEMLMSKGFVKKGSIPPEPWRQYVLDNHK